LDGRAARGAGVELRAPLVVAGEIYCTAANAARLVDAARARGHGAPLLVERAIGEEPIAARERPAVAPGQLGRRRAERAQSRQRLLIGRSARVLQPAGAVPERHGTPSF